MNIGCHVSIRSGYLGAARAAAAAGADAFQYFPKNPRSLSVKRFDRADAEACRRFCRESGLVSIAHTPYPTNLAADDPDLYQATVASVRNDLEIADACGSIGVVVHFGQYKGTSADPLHGYRTVIRMINDILDGWEGEALLLLENNAGMGGRMGTTMEELTQVRQLVQSPEKVAFCLDTCHAFVSGMWSGDDWARVADQGRRLGYLELVRVIHLNDSQYPTGSRRDRHANIGRGHIGETALAELLATPEFAGLPVVLETPNLVPGGHREEMAYVKRMMTVCYS